MGLGRARMRATLCDGSGGGSSPSDRLEIHSLSVEDVVAGPSDHEAANAMLVEQCRSRIEALAPRQRDVLAGLVAGCSNKQIAHMLGISHRTIEIYRAGMMGRLKVRTLAQALHIAFIAGMVPSLAMSLGTG